MGIWPSDASQMINHADKPKDMARSILPSTWRGAWKKRAGLHRSERHAANASLRELTRDPGAWDDGVAFGERPAAELSSYVSRRRASDKLNHFERWAIRRTAALRREDRLSHLRAVLPGGLIGQHALLHLARRRELVVDHEDAWWNRARWQRPVPHLDSGLLCVLLRALHEVNGGVRSLHHAMKSGQRDAVVGGPISVPFRPLRGVHDVPDFVQWLSQSSNGATRDVVDVFCREFRATGDVERAASLAAQRARLPY